MTTLEVTDHAINYQSGNPNYPTWGLSADGTRIGTVWETENGYAGHIEGTTADGGTRQYTCPEMTFRQAVIDRLEIMADRIGIA
jgi:hypothetical protein